jgi:hypothetical protein
MKKIIVLLFVLLLGGCSTQFTYNNASWLVHWYIDDYVEFTREQEATFDDMFARWINWHRRTELPKYEAHLDELMADIRENRIDENRIAYHREKSREHWERARAHVAPDIITLAKTLDQEQIDFLFSQLEKENIEEEEEDAEAAELTSNERREKWIKRNQKGAKKWIGRLTDDQKTHIAQFRDRFERTGAYWLAYRRAYQGALKELFASNDRSELFDERLMELILYPEQYRSSAFVAATEANNNASASYLIGILESAETKQVSRLLDEIEDLKKDIQSLHERVDKT